MKLSRILYCFLGFTVLYSCKSDKVEVYDPTPYYLNAPPNYPEMQIPENNQLTLEGIALGRKLYYDTKLHPLNTYSCSSCHDQNSAFTTSQSNSLPHINLGYNNVFLWNGRIEGTLEDAMIFEVEEFFNTDLERLQDDAEYPDLYFKAFGTKEITVKNTAYALAQFLRSVNSYNSKYDLQYEGLATMTPEEWDGRDIFFTERGDCFHCHGGRLFSDNLFHNNGLDALPSQGRFEVTNNPNDLGKYKTPTLKNIELTGPYMHDGRFGTLEEVVDFYSGGLQWSPTLDPLMKNVGSGGVVLTPEEKAHLVAFLKTFTDQDFISNSNFSNPN